MKSKIDKKELQVLADELDEQCKTLEFEIEQKTKELDQKRNYAKAARSVFLGLEFGGIK